MNSPEPCIKGNALALMIEEAQLSLAGGMLPPKRLQTLPPAVQRLVEDGALNNEWYPVGYYSRLGELLCGTAKLGRRTTCASLASRISHDCGAPGRTGNSTTWNSSKQSAISAPSCRTHG